MKEVLQSALSECASPISNKIIEKVEPVGGGCIHNSWHIKIKNGSDLFAKSTNYNNFDMLRFESECLKELNKFNSKKLILIPEPLAILKTKKLAILLMPWFKLINGEQALLGEGLAQLHKTSAKYNTKHFGWETNGYIGYNSQVKGWGNKWGDFFVNYRLAPQISISRKWGLDIKNLDRFLLLTTDFLNNHKPIPCLVHGDLWGGNTGVTSESKGVIFDPASWWGDREVDIAMTKLFGGFSKSFYLSYQKTWPLDEYSESRTEIYNLYHLLNHANIFGGSYINQSISSIKNIEKMLLKLDH